MKSYSLRQLFSNGALMHINGLKNNFIVEKNYISSKKLNQDVNLI